MSKLAMSIQFVAFALLAGACGEDEDDRGTVLPGALDGGATAIDGALLAPSGDGGADGAVVSTPVPVADPLYLIGSSIQTSNESTLYVWPSRQLEGAKLDFKQATELGGTSEVMPYNGYVYVPSSDDFTITRYELKNERLVAGPAVSMAGLGFVYLSNTGAIHSPERAFQVNDGQFKIVEWNPTTMTITKQHDISALKREGWGNEFRSGYLRSDGKYFLQWTYTNARKEFINSFVLAVFDIHTGQLTIEEDATCPTTAGFGGYFDEQEDLYLMADSFGLFTQFGGFRDPKAACILRVRRGHTELDQSFRQRPSDALGGKFPWGFYYLGNGLAFTSAIDPAITAKFDSVFEILFAPEHEGYLLDVHAGTARKVANLPRDGVGFESHRVDGRLFVPRTTGEVAIENIMSMESTLFEIKPDATAVPIFKLPGYINVSRLR